MRITDKQVCAALAKAAQGAETVSQCVARLLRRVDEQQSEVQTLRRQLRYQQQRVRLLQEAEREREEPAKHLTEDQARGIARARETYLQSRS